jgi:hypothetical protein
MMDPDKAVPREKAEEALAAEHCPTLESMLKKGLPLTRSVWLQQAWGADRHKPAPWSTEHELEVPECFRDHDAVKTRTR